MSINIWHYATDALFALGGAFGGTWVREAATFWGGKSLRTEMRETQQRLEQVKSQLSTTSTLTIDLEKRRRDAIIAVKFSGLKLAWAMQKLSTGLTDLDHLGSLIVKIFEALELFDTSTAECELYIQDHADLLDELRRIKEYQEERVNQVVQWLQWRAITLETFKGIFNPQHWVHPLFKDISTEQEGIEKLTTLMGQVIETKEIDQAIRDMRDPAIWAKYTALVNQAFGISESSSLFPSSDNENKTDQKSDHT